LFADIQCIWFYDSAQCSAIANILKDYGFKFDTASSGKENSIAPNQSDGWRLFNMLQTSASVAVSKN